MFAEAFQEMLHTRFGRALARTLPLLKDSSKSKDKGKDKGKDSEKEKGQEGEGEGDRKVANGGGASGMDADAHPLTETKKREHEGTEGGESDSSKRARSDAAGNGEGQQGSAACAAPGLRVDKPDTLLLAGRWFDQVGVGPIVACVCSVLLFRRMAHIAYDCSCMGHDVTNLSRWRGCAGGACSAHVVVFWPSAMLQLCPSQCLNLALNQDLVMIPMIRYS